MPTIGTFKVGGIVSDEKQILIVIKSLPGVVPIISGRVADSSPGLSASKNSCYFHDIGDPELWQDLGVTWGALKVLVLRQNPHDVISLGQVCAQYSALPLSPFFSACKADAYIEASSRKTLKMDGFFSCSSYGGKTPLSRNQLY